MLSFVNDIREFSFNDFHHRLFASVQKRVGNIKKIIFVDNYEKIDNVAFMINDNYLFELK